MAERRSRRGPLRLARPVVAGALAAGLTFARPSPAQVSLGVDEPRPLLARPTPRSAAHPPPPALDPAPAPPAVAAALSEAPPSCDPGWATRVYRDARASVVRIDNAEGLGSGFLVTPRYVVTAFHVIALGRSIKVTAADGSTRGAEVVATDPGHDLAILSLERPVDGSAPLLPETLPAPVGTPVLAIGHPFALLDRTNTSFDGLLQWTATQGIISERSEGFLQTDAAVNPGNSGGPLLTCDGRVLGVVTAKLGGEAIGFAVPMAHVQALLGRVGREPAYRGRWTPEVLVGGWLQLDPSYTWLGVGLGLGAIGYDRWATQLRGALLWATSTPATSPLSSAETANGGPVLSSQGFRVLVELDETYRALLFSRPFPAYLLFGLGAAFTTDRLSQVTLSDAPVTPGCMPLDSLACEKIVGANTHQTDRRLWPMATVGFVLGGSVEVTYAFQWDVDAVASSEQRILLGVPF